MGVVDLPKFKNNFAYYVVEDWAMPKGFVFGQDWLDDKVGYPSSKDEARFAFIAWLKGDPKSLDYGKYVAYVFYQCTRLRTARAET